MRRNTVIADVPCVPEIRLHCATELTPLWKATDEWLRSVGADVPFWSVPWAGGQALARWVLDHAAEVRGRRVVDFGTGSGLVAIACALAGAASVRAIDVDPLAEAASLVNAEINTVAIDVMCEDVVGTMLETEIVLAGDIWYERAAAARFEPWLASLARSGVRVLTGDPRRMYVPAGLSEVACLEVFTCPDLEATPLRTTRVLELVA